MLSALLICGCARAGSTYCYDHAPRTIPARATDPGSSPTTDATRQDTAGRPSSEGAAPELLASLKEMREACALAVRMIVDAGLSYEYIARGHAREIADGYGVRAQQAIDKAEGR